MDTAQKNSHRNPQNMHHLANDAIVEMFAQKTQLPAVTFSPGAMVAVQLQERSPSCRNMRPFEHFIDDGLWRHSTPADTQVSADRAVPSTNSSVGSYTTAREQSDAAAVYVAVREIAAVTDRGVIAAGTH